jgi:hypothetical protein
MKYIKVKDLARINGRKIKAFFAFLLFIQVQRRKPICSENRTDYIVKQTICY